MNLFNLMHGGIKKDPRIMHLTQNDRILLGDGLFETLRFENQQLIYPQKHWQRLCQSAIQLSIPIPMDYQEWSASILNCIKSTNLNTGGVKVILSAGDAPRGLELTGQNPYFLFQAFTYLSSLKPYTLIKADWLRDKNNPLYQMKSVNYLEAILARRSVQAKGADDALFFNTDNFATETTTANLFIIQSNQILTPTLSCGVLPGIIRQRILDISRKEGIECYEAKIDHQTITEADMLFTSNALQGLRPVARFGATKFNLKSALFTYLQDLIKQDQREYAS